jgi:AraC family transcriptional regulator
MAGGGYTRVGVADLPNLANLDYVARVNRALDHIVQNLAEPLQLEDVAKVACFSPYHFHRIFRALMGETLNAFVKRLRLERAVVQLSHRPGATLTEIALACGFSSSSDFSRSFRAHYGVPPSLFDVERYRATRREQLQRAATPPGEEHRLQRLPPGENPDGFSVVLRPLPARRVAYIRVIKPYEGSGVLAAIASLRAWAEPRGLADRQWLGYQWDDPEIVPLDKCRYDVGLEIPEGVAVEGEIGAMRFPAMTVAELDLAGPIELEMRAIDWIYRTWLPSSGYAPASQPGFEAWNGAPFAHGMEHFELRMQLPVVGLGEPM